MNNIKPLLILLLSVLATLPLKGISQETSLNQTITISFKNETLKSALKRIEKEANVSFTYSNYKVLNQKVTGDFNDLPLRKVLNSLLVNTNLSYKELGGKIVLLKEEKTKISNSKTNTISGYVYDAETGEVLIGATVFDPQDQKGCITNPYGYYSYTKHSKDCEIEVSFLGYSTVKKIFTENTSIHYNFYLSPNSDVMEEIIVRTKHFESPITTNQFEVKNLTINSIKELPSIFGEHDALKAIQLQSGVSTLGEGTSSIFVQGGNSDQNMMLIDDAPIYNPTHLFGLISVFNPDALKNVSFYKSNMPAEFGGKLSSVIDCHMNDGNMNRFQLSGGMGNITAHLAAEGPIRKDTASYLVAIRRSILDFFQNANGNDEISKFYDINAKINWKLNNNNRLFLSFYNSYDDFTKVNDFSNIWGNTTATFRWNHTFSQKLFSNLTTVYSNYTNDWLFKPNNKDYKWLTGVEDVMTKYTFLHYRSPDNLIKFGAEIIYHQFIPGENAQIDQSLFRINALESSIFFMHDIDVSAWLGFNYGVRATAFQNTGAAQWYTYENYALTGNDENDSGIYNTYSSIEPRITVNIKPSANSVFKIGYTRTSQFSQVLQNDVHGYTSLQTWMPANVNIKPLFANNMSMKYFMKINRMFSFSFNAYYRQLENVIDYIDHAQLISNPYIDTQLRTGKGTAYGLNFNATYKTEKLSTEFIYTYSKVFHQIEGINYGEAYNTLYDIPHDLKVSAHYKFNKRISGSAFWNFHTGFACTLPIGYTESSDLVRTPVYSNRNSSRLPNYHRLDLSVNLHPKQNTKRWKGTWSAGIYNAYARFNPIGINPTESFDKVYVYSFYVLVPNISYNFKF